MLYRANLGDFGILESEIAHQKQRFYEQNKNPHNSTDFYAIMGVKKLFFRLFLFLAFCHLSEFII
jgi:hypothetical protein